MIIAVDFDGTIVEHKYPEIGRELPFAIETLKKLQQERHRLILWSVREGKLLQEAVDFCRERGLEFYAVNSNYAEETLESDHYSRKLKADLFIDDRNLGGLPEWGIIYRMIHDKWGYEDIYQSSDNKEDPAEETAGEEKPAEEAAEGDKASKKGKGKKEADAGDEFAD